MSMYCRLGHPISRDSEGFDPTVMLQQYAGMFTSSAMNYQLPAKYESKNTPIDLTLYTSFSSAEVPNCQYQNHIGQQKRKLTCEYIIRSEEPEM